MKRLEIRGVKPEYLTLHIGLGIFREIDVEDLTKHRMDSEQVNITQHLVDVVNDAKDHNKQVCAVGTSALRGLASAVSMGGHIKTYTGWTNKFIFPPTIFRNHIARSPTSTCRHSTMLMMVCAFGGYDLVMKAYKEAIKEKYRFGAYGDAMLII